MLIARVGKPECPLPGQWSTIEGRRRPSCSRQGSYICSPYSGFDKMWCFQPFMSCSFLSGSASALSMYTALYRLMRSADRLDKVTPERLKAPRPKFLSGEAGTFGSPVQRRPLQRWKSGQWSAPHGSLLTPALQFELFSQGHLGAVKQSISCHISKQGCHSHQLFRASRCEAWRQEGTQRGG